MVVGEAVYKAKARIEKYGVKAFVKMLGEKAIKKRGGRKRLLKYYIEKYPGAPFELPAKRPDISKRQKKYWKNVNSLAEERKITIKESRKLLKDLKINRNVRIKLIRQGEGWQLYIKGLFERFKEDFKRLTPPYETAEAEGYSYLHKNVEDYQDCYDECYKEAIESALDTLGGATFGDGYVHAETSDWRLVKILKELWLKYYGREKNE